MMNTPLTLVTSERSDGRPVLAVTGEIDMSNAGTLDEALARSADDSTLVVDLSAVDYLDSAGLTVLFSHAPRIRLIANPLLVPVLTISGLTEVTEVEETSRDGGTRGEAVS
ncbi:anti-anti-sigma factor [Planomonospora parontospora subsp. antibiotica]|nr:STAS domain-containing protein [Planomonospora parontospora]GGL59055.1 anti-anti-sigma factor [Planomonospora parontospora subsp. antibiotica]